MKLRPYQQQALDQSLEGFKKFQRQLVVIPTGGGKTILFAAMAKVIQPERTLILAHREELVDQAIEKLHKATGIVAQKEKAEHRASLQASVVVASIQTMVRRLDKWPRDHFKLVVCDEAHHAISNSWQKVLRHFDAWTLGVTATPDRGDKRNLGAFFENVAFETTMLELINQGYLVPIKVKSVPLTIDVSKVSSKRGDLDEAELGEALEPYLHEVAKAISEHAAFKRTIVFTPLRATSQGMVKACNDIGLSAAHIDGTSEDRKDILKAFEGGRFEVLSNAQLLTEGFDDPGIECVVNLRATKSRAMYSQIVGRGTRLHRHKDSLLLLDFLWQHEKHNLIRPYHLVANCDNMANGMKEIAEAKAGGGQVELDLQGLKSEYQVQREKKLAEDLKAKEKKKSRVMDAMEFCVSLHHTDLADYEPEMEWEYQEPTASQKALLEKNGMDLDSIGNAGMASKVIDVLKMRNNLGLATPKQLRLLRQWKIKGADTMKFETAKHIIGERISKGRRRAA